MEEIPMITNNIPQYPGVSTATREGLMSATDKSKLNNIPVGGNSGFVLRATGATSYSRDFNVANNSSYEWYFTDTEKFLELYGGKNHAIYTVAVKLDAHFTITSPSIITTYKCTSISFGYVNKNESYYSAGDTEVVGTATNSSLEVRIPVGVILRVGGWGDEYGWFFDNVTTTISGVGSTSTNIPGSWRQISFFGPFSVASAPSGDGATYGNRVIEFVDIVNPAINVQWPRYQSQAQAEQQLLGATAQGISAPTGYIDINMSWRYYTQSVSLT
jgi:hypothetical protein